DYYCWLRYSGTVLF
nr:immunoglobulin light chain junction region [Macaca mulatta]